ncbi:Threonyl-tRNA_synthetase [Hexamita inflata]|uniref:threonine--tRNA ligase n=2 Tax=Hexamita inflata TaxID=28002 RepID=A0AA86Q8R0_9EUKA|nr:Threonyl-tRNA synthetase [Hexamita inflata]
MDFIAERSQKFQKLQEKYVQQQPEVKQVTVTTPDGAKHEASTAQTYMEFAKALVKNSKIYSKFLAAKVDGELVDLSRNIEKDCVVQFVQFSDAEGKEVFWHSSAHVLGATLEKLYDGHLGHGPAVDNGFFYDCFIPSQKVIDVSQLEKISKEMKNFVVSTQEKNFVRLLITKEEALDLFSYSKLKMELIQDHVKEGELCSVYRCGSFVDFCRGPHVPELSVLKAFNCSASSAAYFKGDQTRESMQRVYAIAFPSETELKEHLEMIEDAKRRDHRVLGSQMELFTMHKFAPGMPLFCNNGTLIFRRLEGFVRSLLHKYHYIEVMTPNFLNTDLWKISGHLQNYSENMFFLQQKLPTDPLFGLKPMNCPAHCLIYNSQFHSKAELPIRMSEFGVCHRNELSGALSGLTRVCKFEQDDAHIFCTVEQIFQEITSIMSFLKDAYKPFGLKFSFALSLRPEHRIGSDQLWDEAENSLRSVLVNSGFAFIENPGDGAFYGPKIDVKLTDALNRQHQCGTVQLDFNLPSADRFNLTYADFKDGKQVQEHPVMIHRAILGSIERFMAVIIEHTAGKFPFWISPRQAVVIPVRAEFNQYASQVSEMIYQAGYEVKPDLTDEKMSKKIAQAFAEKYNFVLVVGQKESETMSVTVQGRSMALVDKVTDKPEKYSKSMQVEELIKLFGQLRDTQEAV